MEKTEKAPQKKRLCISLSPLNIIHFGCCVWYNLAKCVVNYFLGQRFPYLLKKTHFPSKN
jgi:hypothetical protein